MAQTIIQQVTRFSYIGQWTNNRPVVNIIDVAWDEDGTGLSRPEAIESVAEDVRNAWQDHIVGALTDNYTFLRVNWVDLDNANGSVGSIAADPGRPDQGTGAGPSAPPSQCLQVNKITTRTRGARAGRWFLAGLTDAAIEENGQIGQSTIDAFNSLLDDYLESVSDVGGLAIDKAPVVISVTQGVGNRITSMECAPLVAYQGRRIGR